MQPTGGASHNAAFLPTDEPAMQVQSFHNAAVHVTLPSSYGSLRANQRASSMQPSISFHNAASGQPTSQPRCSYSLRSPLVSRPAFDHAACRAAIYLCSNLRSRQFRPPARSTASLQLQHAAALRGLAESQLSYSHTMHSFGKSS
jgi:hypothetical protein